MATIQEEILVKQILNQIEQAEIYKNDLVYTKVLITYCRVMRLLHWLIEIPNISQQNKKLYYENIFDVSSWIIQIIQNSMAFVYIILDIDDIEFTKTNKNDMDIDYLTKNERNEQYVNYENENLLENFNEDIWENVSIKPPIEFPSVWTPEKARKISVRSDAIPLKLESSFKTMDKPYLNPFSEEYRRLLSTEKISKKDVEMTPNEAHTKHLAFDEKYKEKWDTNANTENKK